MEEFVDSITRAMGPAPAHIVSATLDYPTWKLAGKPHTWQRVEQSLDGSIAVWLDTAYGFIAVQYEEDGHACFAYGDGMIATPAFVIINRTIYPNAQAYIWRADK